MMTTEPAPTPPPTWQPPKNRNGCGVALAIVALLVVVLAGLAILGAVFGSDDDNPTQAEEVNVTGCTTNALGLVEVSGTVKNSSSKRSDYIIEVVILNGETQIGTGTEFVRSVDAGRTATWTAFTTARGAGVVTCRVTDVERNASL